MRASLLHGFTPSEVICQPFAHVVRDAAVETERYEKLTKSFPTLEQFVGEQPGIPNNRAIRIPAKTVIEDERFAPEWREFFRYHTSSAFWHDILAGMASVFRTHHPQLERQAGKPFEDWEVSRRGENQPGDVELDALFVVNTPVKWTSSVRPAHVDARDKIWVGLFYLREPGDATPGGQFSLYRFKHSKTPAFGGSYAPLDRLEEVTRIDYVPNRLLTFANTATSIHGVTPRPPTPFARRYISLIAKTPHQIFDLPELPLLKRLGLWRQRRRSRSGGLTLDHTTPTKMGSGSLLSHSLFS